MLRRLTPLLIAAALAIPVTFSARPAAAQDDDWDVKKNPFSKEIVNKWKGILERNPADNAALKKLIDLYTKYSKVDKLIEEYEAQLAKKPDSYAYNMILGHLHRNRSQVKEAVENYEAAAKIDASDPVVYIALAELYRQQRKVAEATTAYEKALPLAKDNKGKKAIYRALADLYLDQKDIDKAKKYFADYIALDPSDTTARRDLADALAKHDLHEEALKEYKAALDKLGTDPAGRVDVLARIGGEYEALGKIEDAVSTYRQAMEATQKGHYLRKELTERIIDIYRKRQDLRGLIAYYEKTWSVASRGHFEWDVLARIYEETGEQDKALDAYRKAVEEAPYELDTQRRLIALLVRAGREDEAIKAYENVIKVAPGEPRFQLELAERYAKTDKKKALAMAKEIAKRFPDDPGVHAALADMYVRWNEEQLALKEYETLVKIEPEDATHLVNLGEQWHQRGEKGKAQDIWKKIAVDKTPEGYARLAEVYAEHDMGSDAIDMYLKAIALKPKDPMLYKGLAGVLERQRQDDKAIDAWETVMKLTDGDATQKPLRREARTRIIAVYQRKNGLLNKTRDWQRKFQGSPPDIEAGYFLAEAYLKLSKPDDARRILEGLLKADPKDLDAKYQLVQVMKSLRRYDEAIALIQQLIVNNPGHERQYYTEIAELQLIQHHYDQAIYHAKKALEKNPNDAAALERLAEIYASGGSAEDYRLAVEAYKKAIELNPHNFKVHKALAKLYENHGEYAETAKLYRQIVAHGSDEEMIRAAAHKAIDVEEFLGTLGDLEKELAPLAFQITNKATYRRILVEVYDRYVDPLVAKAKRGDAAAQKELIRLGEHGLKPLLEALTDTTDQQQQQIAVRVLGYLGNKNAAPPLVKLAMETPAERTLTGPVLVPGAVLTVDPQAGVAMKLRVEALVAAGRLGDPRTIPQLVKLLENREVALREGAAWALGQTHDKKAVEPLIKALDDTRSSVQAMACIGLGQLSEKRGDSKALDAVASTMKDAARGVEARAACAYALGVAGNPAYVPALAQVVGDGNDEVQVKAAWALGRIGDARAKGALLAAYWAKKETVREAVLWALGRVMAGQPDTTPLAWVDPVLTQEKIDWRMLVRGLVGELPRQALPASVVKGQAKEIAEGLDAALGRHRDVIVRVLRDLDGRDGGLALGQLTAGLESASAADRVEIEKLIADVGSRIAGKIDLLCEHRDPEVRMLAADILAKLKDPRAEARLIKLLADDSEMVRFSALASVERYVAGGGTGGKQLAAAVVKRLSAKGFDERIAAMDTLGRLGAATDTSVLTAAFADSDGFVRQAAADAIAKLKRTDAVPALLEASHADEDMVRLAVVKALTALGDPRAKARLNEMAKDDESRVVREAASKHL